MSLLSGWQGDTKRLKVTPCNQWSQNLPWPLEEFCLNTICIPIHYKQQRAWPFYFLLRKLSFKSFLMHIPSSLRFLCAMDSQYVKLSLFIIIILYIPDQHQLKCKTSTRQIQLFFFKITQKGKQKPLKHLEIRMGLFLTFILPRNFCYIT